MSQQQLLHICQQLAAEGKTPSVALVRARMTNKEPMQAVIKAVQLWKQNPEMKLPPMAKPEEQQPSQSLEQRVEQLEKQVAELKQALQIQLEAK